MRRSISSLIRILSVLLIVLLVSSCNETKQTTTIKPIETTTSTTGAQISTSPGTSDSKYTFTSVAIGGLDRIIALDSQGKIWEFNPEKDQIIRAVGITYSDDPSTWENVIDVSAGLFSIVALFEDGTVRYDNFPIAYDKPDAPHPLFDLSNWKDIVDVSCGINTDYVAGLRSNGTVITESYEDLLGETEIHAWTDIVEITAGQDTIFGCRSDGTVVASSAAYLQSQEGIYRTVDEWENITMIDAGMRIIAGLCADGTVVLGGINKIRFGAEEVSTWTNITDISVCYKMTVGLTDQGTVHLVGNTDLSQDNIEDLKMQVKSWTDIVDIAVFDHQMMVVGLKEDGTILLAINEKNSHSASLTNAIEKWNENIK